VPASVPDVTQTQTQTRTTYRSVLAEPRFRILLVTQTVGVVADVLRTVALSVLVYAATGSPLLGALTYGVAFVPQVFGGALLGAVADRVRPRRLITVGYATETAAALVLALTPLPVAARLLLVAAVACVTPVFLGASGRVVAEVLNGDAYVLGRSLRSMSASGGQLLGFAAGGAAVGLLGTRGALLTAAGCHAAAALLVRTRLPDLPLPHDAAGASAVAASWRGNRELLSDRGVRMLLVAHWAPAASASGAEGLVVPYATSHGRAALAGPLLACLPVGMLVGDVIVGRLVRPPVRERLVVPLVLLVGLPLMVFALNPPLLAPAALLLLSGAGSPYSLGLSRPYLDAVPDRLRGQSFGLLSTGLMTVQGIGPAVAGGLAELVRIAPAMGLAGAAGVACGTVLHRPLSRLLPG